MWDRASDSITRITNGDEQSLFSTISADGRYIGFASRATNLVPNDTGNGKNDVFLWDRTTGTTSRVIKGNDHSGGPRISADGGHLTFSSLASNLVPGDTDNSADVYVWDRFAR